MHPSTRQHAKNSMIYMGICTRTIQCMDCSTLLSLPWSHLENGSFEELVYQVLVYRRNSVTKRVIASKLDKMIVVTGISYH